MEQMTRWIDISDACRSCARELQLKKECPMIFSSAFSLHDSMSAVEIMDAKMDQCYGLQSHGLRISTLFDIEKLNDKLNVQVVQIILQRMLSGLINFFDGSSLLDSTQLCALLWSQGLESLASISHTSPLAKVLYASSGCVLSSIKSYYDIIVYADIFEDEDFCPSSRTAVAQWSPSFDRTMELVNEALLDIKEHPTLQSFVLVILHVAQFLDSFNAWFDRLKLKEHTESFCDIDSTRLYTMVSSITSIQTPMKTLFPIDEENFDPPSRQVLESLFHPLIVKMHQVGPVKQSNNAGLTTLLLKLSSLCTQLEKTLNAMKILASSDTLSFEVVLDRLSAMSASRNSHLLTRSLVMGFVLSFAHNLDKLMMQSMLIRGVPRAICDELKLMGTQSSMCIAGLEQCRVFTVCRDRAAYRLVSVLAWWGRAGGEAIFGSLGSTVSVPTDLSESMSPKSLWLSTWISLHTTKAMDLYFRLLIEMDIIEAYEWDYFYWYWDFVCSAYSHALDKLEAMNQEQVISSQIKDASKTKRHPVSSPLPSIIFADDLVLKGRGFLCKGMFRVAILLKKLNLLSCPPLSRAVVFSRRFAAFEEIISPSPLSYNDFVDTVYRGNEFDLQLVDSYALASSAATCFQNAKKCFDEARRGVTIADDSLASLLGESKCSDEAMNLTKVAVAYSLELTKLCRYLQSSPQASKQLAAGSVQWSNRYHPHFPVVSIGGM